MGGALANNLYNLGKGHAGAACLLYRASHEHAEREGIEDRAKFAFNGPFSLAAQYLLGLGIELMLKAAVVACDPEADAELLRRQIGHDLVKALEEAERRGFRSDAPNLRRLVEVLREPYSKHWFRYELPPPIDLPSDFDQVVDTLNVLDKEVAAKLA